MQKLLNDLFGCYDGKPILVIAGGPSVARDLPKLYAIGFRPACVLSANAHGFKQNVYPIDFAVNVDKQHCALRTPMELVLRPFGKPIINRHSWADYRLPNWTFSGNTGLTSIAIACALGGNPVVPLGIDFWSTGRCYFHSGQETKKHASRTPSKPNRKVKNLVAFCAGANIRPVSGPLAEVFPRLSVEDAQTGASLPPRKDVAYRMAVAGVERDCYVARRAFTFGSGNQDRVAAGATVLLTEREAAPYVRNGRLEKVPLSSVNSSD